MCISGYDTDMLNKKRRGGVYFYCFSPAVMIATFLIEFIGAAYILYRYKMSVKTRLIVALLVCLGLFQLAEYFVCTQSDVAVSAARAGYIAITFLPPLGYHLMSTLTASVKKRIIYALYVIGFVISAYFLTAPQAFEGYRCTGNYVIFQIGGYQTAVYSAYYFGIISTSVLKGIRYLQLKAKKGKAAVKWLLAGYGLFIIPVAILVVIHPDTSQALPSILCGFAVLLAIVLIAKVSPLTLKLRK